MAFSGGQFLLIFILLASSANAQSTQELIDKICRQMEDYGFCNKMFHDNIGSRPGTMATLVDITIHQVLLQVMRTQDTILRIISVVRDYETKLELEVCQGEYDSVTEAFEDAKRFFIAKKYDLMRRAESPAARAQASCKFNFSADPPRPWDPVVEMNRRARILVSMGIVAGLNMP